MTDTAATRHGQVLAGRYRLTDTVAVGGSGTVYRAEVEGEGQPVAVKVMHAEHPEGDAERRRFEREAQIIQELVHPHVVRVLDYGHTGDRMPFLVFPLLEGRTLDSRLKSSGGLPAAEVGRLALQVLSALDRAHERGIAHRDIKPANIFLVPSALGDNVQILDFGLAKLVFDKNSADVTRHGALVGTPRYMAPEQVRGEQVSETADIYSFGLVMAEMLLGRPVVSAAREIDIYMTHGSDKPLELPPEVTGSPWAAIIRRAVAKPLEVRYRRAAQMHADVKAALERMNAGGPQIAAVDMDVTFVVNPNQARPLSLPTDTSEKLRDAFNKMAGTKDDDIPEAAPTLVRASAEPEAPSLPILLTKESTDELDTMRLRAEARAPETAPAPPRPPAAPDPALEAAVAEAEQQAAASARRNAIVAITVVAAVLVAFMATFFLGGR